MTEALEEEDQRRVSDGAHDAMEQDEELEIVGVKEAHEVGLKGVGDADKAGPMTEGGGNLQALGQVVVHAGRCLPIRPPPTAGAAGSTPGMAPDPPGHGSCGVLSLRQNQSLGWSHGTLMREVVEKAEGGRGSRRWGTPVTCEGRTEWAPALLCGMAARLSPFPVVPWRDMIAVQEANLGWVCTWHTHRAGMDPPEWQAKAVVTYLSWSLPTAPGTWAQLCDRALHWAGDGSAVAACPDAPHELVSVQPWSVPLHLPTVEARFAAADPGVLLLGGREGPGLPLGRGPEARTARLPSPVEGDILEGLQCTQADGADVWTTVHRQLPNAWPQAFRPPGHERLVGVEWRLWAANSPCLPVVVLPRRTSHPSWGTVAVLWGWVAVRGTGGHVFTVPRSTVIEMDGEVALQLTAEPLTTHVVVAVLQ